MIEETRPEHADGIMAVAKASGLFDSDQLDTLREALQLSFETADEPSDCWFTDLDGDRPVGVAYCTEEVMTDRTWNLLFLAVLPEVQDEGRGGTLLKHVEQALRGKGARLLIIETSNGEEFEGTQHFYRSHGYEEEGTVRDFYEDGAHKVVFRKAL